MLDKLFVIQDITIISFIKHWAGCNTAIEEEISRLYSDERLMMNSLNGMGGLLESSSKYSYDSLIGPFYTRNRIIVPPPLLW